jgi:hypothetical protein
MGSFYTADHLVLRSVMMLTTVVFSYRNFDMFYADRILFHNLFQCFKIWDLDVRGYHKSMWRLHMKGNEMLVIGVPNSEYA